MFILKFRNSRNDFFSFFCIHWSQDFQNAVLAPPAEQSVGIFTFVIKKSGNSLSRGIIIDSKQYYLPVFNSIFIKTRKLFIVMLIVLAKLENGLLF